MKNYIGKIKKLKNHNDYFPWLIKYTKPFLPQILFLLFLSVASTLINIFQAIISKDIVDSAIYNGVLSKSVIIYAALFTVTILITAVNSSMTVMLNEKFSFGIRKQLYERIISAHWLDVTKYHTGDLMTRLTSDAQNISNGIIFTIPTMIILVVQFVVTFLVLFHYEPVIAISALAIGPFALVVSYFFGRHLKRLEVKVQETESSYRSFLQESISNLLIVKAFTNEAYASEKLVELRENRFDWVKKRMKLSVTSSAIMSFTFQCGYIIAFTYGAMQVASGDITYGTMTIFITLIGRVQTPLVDLAKNIPKIILMIASAERVIKIQEIPIEEKIATTIKAESIGVTLNHMTFGYTEDEILFDDANVVIKPHEFVAIVGESGIGKTTLVRLIMSFVSQTRGDIHFSDLNGNVEAVNAGLRDYISYVPQGNTLFSGTIRENLKMGRLDATETEMVEMLKIAAAWKFIKDFPKGIDTVIGEKGHGLSEGQAQRVAIARALIRRAPLLILDEATSALDEDTELEVLNSIHTLEPKPTCLIITHRRTVLDYCNREIEIVNKKITSVLHELK